MGSPLAALLIDCVAPVFAGFDSGRRALEAGSVMGVGGGSGESARRPDGDAWWPFVMPAQVRGRGAE